MIIIVRTPQEFAIESAKLKGIFPVSSGVSFNEYTNIIIEKLKNYYDIKKLSIFIDSAQD
jgi:hypothetical protein